MGVYRIRYEQDPYSPWLVQRLKFAFLGATFWSTVGKESTSTSAKELIRDLMELDGQVFEKPTFCN